MAGESITKETNTCPPLDRKKEQLLVAKISIIGSIVLFLISAIVGIMVDSITLILDASASLVILVSAFLMSFAVNKIHCPPDGRYNFGYHKYEPLTAAIQNGLIIATCVVSVKFAIQDIVHPEDIHGFGLPVIATFVAGIIGIFIAAYLRREGKKTHSQMVKAAGFHWFIDTAMSFGVCAGFTLGLFLEKSGYTNITPYVDPVMSIILAVFFVALPIKGGLTNLFELLDAAPEEDISDKVKKVVERYIPRSFGVDRLRVRKAGQKVFVDICFVVMQNLTVKQIEALAQEFERDLKTHLPDCDVVVYFKSKK